MTHLDLEGPKHFKQCMYMLTFIIFTITNYEIQQNLNYPNYHPLLSEKRLVYPNVKIINWLTNFIIILIYY